MKKLFFIVIAIGTCHFTLAQDIHKSGVPSVIINQFINQFPKATDVEWEMEGKLYKVEFETPRNVDHDVWYNHDGKMVKHKEEISSKKLPQAIEKSIKDKYSNYKIDDVHKITEGNTVIYSVEIEKFDREIMLYFNENGTQI